MGCSDISEFEHIYVQIAIIFIHHHMVANINNSNIIIITIIPILMHKK